MIEPTAPNRRNDVQPVRTGSDLIPMRPPSWHSAEEHADALLDWMQGPGGRVGEVPARELMRLHIEMCAELFWQQTPCDPVAKAFRKLISDPHHHGLVLELAMASLIRATARGDSGTRVISLFFRRAPTCVHMGLVADKSISALVIPAISPIR